MEWLPTMYTTKDKAKVIAAFIVLILSVVFSEKFDSGNEELVTALSVLVSYLLGLYSETYNKKDGDNNE